MAVSQLTIFVFNSFLSLFSGCDSLHEPMPIYGVSLDPCTTGVQLVQDNGSAAFDSDQHQGTGKRRVDSGVLSDKSY